MQNGVNTATEFAELLMSEHGFRSLVENAAVAVGVTDTRGRFAYVNKAMTDLLGILFSFSSFFFFYIVKPFECPKF